jgi:hypothetical protein
MKTTMKILIAGILLAMLMTGCLDLLKPGDLMVGGAGGEGNVTITFDSDPAGRTIRPNNIAAVSAFEWIELEFTKDGASKIIALNKGTTTYSETLEQGRWNINARGFMKIEDREYEAAWGSAVVTVGSSPQAVNIELRTGILGYNPGVFRYNIDLPGTVTEAVLEISSLPDLYGYEIATDGKTVDLMQGKTGSFDLLPGFYLLTLSAKIGTTMAIWNELVHIYSGQETAASHTFAAGDFSNTVTLSGTASGGELDGNHVTGAVVTAYGDEDFLNRIASVNVSGFTKMADAPYYYSSPWSMTVPGSLSGKDLYFRVEETLDGPAGDQTYVWEKPWWNVNVSTGGVDGIALELSYTWSRFAASGNYDELDYTIAADGVVTAITHDALDGEGDAWRQKVTFSFPAKTGIRYVYEFEAWTQNGTRTLSIQHINNDKYDIYESEEITIDEIRKPFTVISGVRYDPYAYRQVEFQLGYPVTGTLFFKIKSIKPAIEYIPPGVDGAPRFTATAVSGGIRLRADLRGLPDELRGLMFFDSATDTQFTTEWIWGNNGNLLHPEYYAILFPYVQAGKEYTFRLEYMLDNNIILGRPTATATATSGRGELLFNNRAELAVIKEGNEVKFNRTPTLSNFTRTNVTSPHYVFQMASGSSWADPLAEWKYSYELSSTPRPVDLIAVLNELDDWVNTAGFLNRTCFAEFFYAFTYSNSDVYLEGGRTGQNGTFRTTGIFSTPFVYPNVVPAVFTAVPHEEGVKLSIDLTRLPAGTNNLNIMVEPANAQLWIGGHEWKYNEWGAGRFYGQSSIEIIYPFVQPGKTYTFEVTYDGSGAVGRATVTPAAGLGDLTIPNAATVGLTYRSGTKTLSLTTPPTAPTIGDSPHIDDKRWVWEYYKGYNWSKSDWKGVHNYNEPIQSVVFDDTFDKGLAIELSNAHVFVSVAYVVEYRGFNFGRIFVTSPSFRFPAFEYDPLRDATPLNPGTWVSGFIFSGSGDPDWYSDWYAIEVTAGQDYYIWWNDSDNTPGYLDVKVAAYYSNMNEIFDVDNFPDNYESFSSTSTGTVYIKVYPYGNGSTGYYEIAYSTNGNRPD